MSILEICERFETSGYASPLNLRARLRHRRAIDDLATEADRLFTSLFSTDVLDTGFVSRFVTVEWCGCERTLRISTDVGTAVAEYLATDGGTTRIRAAGFDRMEVEEPSDYLRYVHFIIAA